MDIAILMAQWVVTNFIPHVPSTNLLDRVLLAHGTHCLLGQGTMSCHERNRPDGSWHSGLSQNQYTSQYSWHNELSRTQYIYKYSWHNELSRTVMYYDKFVTSRLARALRAMPVGLLAQWLVTNRTMTWHKSHNELSRIAQWLVTNRTMTSHKSHNDLSRIAQWVVTNRTMTCHESRNDLSGIAQWLVMNCTMTCHESHNDLSRIAQWLVIRRLHLRYSHMSTHTYAYAHALQSEPLSLFLYTNISKHTYAYTHAPQSAPHSLYISIWAHTLSIYPYEHTHICIHTRTSVRAPLILYVIWEHTHICIPHKKALFALQTPRTSRLSTFFFYCQVVNWALLRLLSTYILVLYRVIPIYNIKLSNILYDWELSMA